MIFFRALDNSRQFLSIVVALNALFFYQLVSAENVQPDDLGIQEIQVTARRLVETRQSLMPSIGTSSYQLDLDDLKNLPLGTDAPLNEVLLRSPGVVADSFGQIHVRGDHANVQYRINDIVIPESIALFGQSISPRLADTITLLTGALPAQYGYRTAGVIDIHTKGMDHPSSSEATLTWGSDDHQQIAMEMNESVGDWSMFGTFTVLHNNLGIENPLPTRTADHDQTQQINGFWLLQRELADGAQLSMMLGESNNNFEIPNTTGIPLAYVPPNLTIANLPTLNENQHEGNRFAIVSFANANSERLHYQIALSERFTDIHYRPDPNLEDLYYTGVSADIARSNNRVGIQADAAWRADDFNVVRFGVMSSYESVQATTNSVVYPLNADQSVQYNPLNIVQSDKPITRLAGAYVQDEWHATEKLTVNGGLRLDYLEGQTTEGALGPRVGLVYSAGQGWDWHMGYARYFTPPPSEKVALESVALFADTTNAPLSTGNDPVRAERSHYWDVGVLKTIGTHWSFGVDGYLKRSSDLLDEGQFGNALVYAPFNYADGRIQGIELSSSWHQDNSAAYINVATGSARGKDIVSGQYNFGDDELNAIRDQYVHLDHDQRLTISTGLSTRWLSTNWGLDGLFGSGLRSGFINSEHLPSYTSVNLSARREFAKTESGSWEIGLSVINLLDRVYELRDGTGIGVGAPQFGQRQTVYLSLTRHAN